MRKKATDSHVPNATKKVASGANGYIPPTAEEMSPMRPEYLAELAKVHEPPEMAGKPMQVRKALSPAALKVGIALSALGSPEKATHKQRATAIHDLLEIVRRTGSVAEIDKGMIYGVIAITTCLDGANPQVVIGYANEAIAAGGDALTLRAKMRFRAGDRNGSLDDLEKVMAEGNRYALGSGGVNPRKNTVPCEWSARDFDALGNDPRALAAKGMYLSAFISYGAEGRGTVKEEVIRDLYARSATSWQSPIPHFLKTTLDGLGSEHLKSRYSCFRGIDRAALPDIARACEAYDEGTRQKIRDLTMALLIDPQFSPALSARAEQYLNLAQGFQADGKPSRQLFERAIEDFTAALALQGKGEHTLYVDRGLALASLGKYQEAAASYIEGMKHAEGGIEQSPFVYEQLANVYMKLGKFKEAADLLTQALMNVSGGGMDSIIFSGGMSAFRTLYPEYDALPDEILAEAVRRRYQPQFQKSWDAGFISGPSYSKGKMLSSVLVDLFVMRGDAYMKAGRRAEALADYRRVKSDAWSGPEEYLPRRVYFNERGVRNFDQPKPWPPSPPKL